MKRLKSLAPLALAVLLAGGLFAAVFVNLAVDPPLVVQDFPCVSDCRRDASGVSFALESTGVDLDFVFLGLPDGAPVSYVVSSDGTTLLAGEGASLPLSDLPLADRVTFFSPDPSVDWGAVSSVRATRRIARAALAAPKAASSEIGYTFSLSVENPSEDFSLFGISAPGGSAAVDDFGFEFTAPTWTNAISYSASGGSFVAASTGLYTFQIDADDYARVTIGDTAVTSAWPGKAPGDPVKIFMRAGERHPVSVEGSSIGGPARLKKLQWGVFSPCDPKLVVTPGEISFHPKGLSASDFVSVSVSGFVSGCEVSCDYSGSAIEGRDGRYSPVVSDPWWSSNDTLTVSFKLSLEGRIIAHEKATFSILRPKVKDECTSCCSEGTQSGIGCVSFSQKFGRTPGLGALPTGALRIEESRRRPSLWSPQAFFYDHPAMRRLVSRSGSDSAPDAVVREPDGTFVEYGAGLPVHSSLGRSMGLAIGTDGNPVETLPDRTRVAYGPEGDVIALAAPDADFIPVAELGISVFTNEAGALISVVSRADGRIDVARTGASGYEAVWRDAEGNPVKTFRFSGDGESLFELAELRPGGAACVTRWTWVPSAGDWSMTKAPGSAESLTKSRAVRWDARTRTFEIEETCADALGTPVLVETSTLDAAGGANIRTGRTRGGRRTLAAERDSVSGRIASETDARGARTDYAYDEYGRVTRVCRTAEGLAEETLTTYSDAAPAGGDVDRRPRRVVRTRGGVTVSDTETRYESNRVTRIRRFGGKERVSFHERDSLGRTVLEVSEGGRATQTAYSGMAADFSWTRTVTEGVWRNGAFATVADKSTRVTDTFDASGNAVRILSESLVGETWRETGWTTNRFDAAHKVVFSERSDGRTTSAAWNCTGALWERGEDGVVTSNRYDGVKRKASSTRYGRHGEVTTLYSYDAAGRVIRETESGEGCADTNIVTRAYDGRGRIVSETDAQGRTTLSAYSADGLVTTVTFADGGTRMTTLNPDGSLASVTGTAVTPEYHTYGVTADGLEWTCVRYGRADSPRYEKTYRNGFGETVCTERAGFGGATLVTENAYDDKGRLVSVAETGQPTVTYVYDDWGDRVSTTQSADGVTRITEETQGYALLGGAVWRGGSRTVRTSDPAIAPLVTESYAKVSGLALTNIAESFTVDVRGNTNRTWSALDPSEAKRTTWTSQAGVGNVAFSESVDGVTVLTVDAGCVTNTTACDAFRRQTATTDGRGNRTSYAYDALGRLASQTDAATNTTHYAYDAMGRVVAVTNALGGVTLTRYDLRGNKTYEGGATYPVSYTYDVYGNKVSMTTYRDEEGQSGDTTNWIYDEASGLLTRKTYADGRGPCYNYTDDGKLLSRIWARGVTTTYSYDAWGNLTATTYSDGTPSVMLGYDALGRQKRVTDAAGTTTFTYDDHGDEAQVEVTGLYSKTLVRHRDAFGRDLGHTVDGTRKNVIEYDSDSGRIHREQLGGAWYVWSYLPGTSLKSSLSVGTAAITTWSYETNRDLLAQVKNTVFGRVASQYDYANDALGRRMAISRSGTMMSETRNDAYGYNARSELTNAVKNATWSEYAYLYDDIGNRESSIELDGSFEYVANPLNQYTQISTVNLNLQPQPFVPSYDADGNQTLVKTSTGEWHVTYNAENRPVSWTCGATNIVMTFNRMGRRVELIETVANPAESSMGSNFMEGSVVTNRHQKFVYDGYLCIQRLNGANNAVTDLFEWDPTELVATRPLYWQARTTSGNYSLFYTHDGNKNVSEAVFYQRARGVAAHYEYAPFGEVTAQTRGDGWGTLDFASLNPWRFSSEHADDATATVYYNYRHYEPVTGRWLSRDPIEEKGGVCLYAFCSNRSVSELDIRGGILFVPIVFAKAMAYAIAAMTAYQATACYNATKDMQPTETDAYRHCYISCAYSKCMEEFIGKYVSQAMTLLGGLFWEIVGSLQEDGSFSIEDLKSDLIGVMGSLDYSSCEKPCECERGKVNPK